MTGEPKVYVVDDDRDLGGSVARLLCRRGFAAEPFIDPVILLNAYVEAPASCIVTDVMMDDLDGFGFADRVRFLDPAVAIVFMTAWVEDHRAAIMAKTGTSGLAQLIALASPG